MSTESEPPKPRPFWWRIVLLLAIIVGLILVGRFTPLGNYMSIPYLRDLILGAGFWGILIFIGAFIVASIMNLPSSIFLVFSILVFGYWQGIGITYISAILAATITFHFARFISGKALTEIRNVRIKRLISQAELHPFRTILLLRTFMQLSPLVGYTMAMTGMKPRHYFIGNLIGLVIPIAYLSVIIFLLRDQLNTWFGIDF